MLQVSIRIVSLFNHSGDKASAGWLSLDRLGPFCFKTSSVKAWPSLRIRQIAHDLPLSPSGAIAITHQPFVFKTPDYQRAVNVRLVAPLPHPTGSRDSGVYLH